MYFSSLELLGGCTMIMCGKLFRGDTREKENFESWNTNLSCVYCSIEVSRIIISCSLYGHSRVTVSNRELYKMPTQSVHPYHSKRPTDVVGSAFSLRLKKFQSVPVNALPARFFIIHPMHTARAYTVQLIKQQHYTVQLQNKKTKTKLSSDCWWCLVLSQETNAVPYCLHTKLWDGGRRSVHPVT